MTLDKFTIKAQEAVQAAVNIAQQNGQQSIEPVHLLKGVIEKGKIKENGTVDHFKQGKQEFLRESPALKSYNTTIQRYSLLYKQLTDLLPPPEVDSKKKNEVLDFITKQG